MTIYAPAKINLCLDVLGKRQDGYHDIKTIMSTVNIYDTVTVNLSKRTFLACTKPYIPTDGRNLCLKALSAFCDYTGRRVGARINVTKQIPVGAGLGGGSSNAAAVIVALARLTGIRLSTGELTEIGLAVGADVPFFFYGGTCLCEGLGELVTPLKNNSRYYVLIVKPSFPVSTKWCYDNMRPSGIFERPNASAMAEELKLNGAGWARRVSNVLEIPAISAHGEIAEIKQQLIERGAVGASMSGSGSAVFGIFASKGTAQTAHKKMKSIYEECYLTSHV